MEELEQHRPLTVGDALEVAGKRLNSTVVDYKHVAAIQTAETCATGSSDGILSKAAENARSLSLAGSGYGTIGDALHGAKTCLAKDKVVTQKDAYLVQGVEQATDPHGQLDPSGIGMTMQEAANRNEADGFTSQSAQAPEVVQRTDVSSSA